MRKVTFQFSGPIAVAHYDSGYRQYTDAAPRAIMACGCKIPLHMLRAADSNAVLCTRCEKSEKE